MHGITETRRHYVANSYNELWTPHKSSQRQHLVDTISDHFKTDCGKKRFLTLPGAWWHFERLLNKDRFLRKWWPHITACENIRPIFDAAVLKMPICNKAIKSKWNQELDCHVITNGKTIVFFHCDVGSLLEYLPLSFDVIWLDFCQPVSVKIMKIMEDAITLLNPNGLLCVNLLQAREDLETLRLIDRRANGDRLRFITQFCEERLDGQSHQLWRVRYNDGVPMAQWTFLKQML